MNDHTKLTHQKAVALGQPQIPHRLRRSDSTASTRARPLTGNNLVTGLQVARPDPASARLGERMALGCDDARRRRAAGSCVKRQTGVPLLSNRLAGSLGLADRDDAIAGSKRLDGLNAARGQYGVPAAKHWPSPGALTFFVIIDDAIPGVAGAIAIRDPGRPRAWGNKAVRLACRRSLCLGLWALCTCILAIPATT